MKNVGFGDYLIHISPIGDERFLQTNLMEMSFTGAEANVCAALSYWGEQVEFVTCLPENMLAQKGIRFLKEFDIKTDHIPFCEGRMGTYYLENGRSLRPSYVVYDRNDTAFTKSEFQDYDWDAILEDTECLYMSGITPNLSENLYACCLALLKETRNRNIRTFFDINYRPSLGTPEKAKAIMQTLMPYITNLIGNEEHFKMIFSISSQYGEDDSKNRLKDVTAKIQDVTNIENVAVTVRRTISSSETLIYAALRQKDIFAKSPERRIPVIDRVGSGDAFSAGLIYAFIQNFSPQDSINFASASCAMKHTITKDINFATVEEIKNLIKSDSSDVKR